jgi:hypothetical protein
MKKASLFLFFTLLLVLVAGASPVLARGRVDRVAGEIIELDAETGDITLQARNAGPLTVRTAGAELYRKVYRGGLEPITFDDLAVGDRIQAEGVWDGDSFDASELRLLAPLPSSAPAVVNGAISDSPNAETGVFTVQPFDGDPVTVKTGDTEYYRQLRQGRLEPIAFGDLANGDRVRVEGTWDGGVLMASKVLVKPPAPLPAPAVVNGTISGSPNAEAGTFTVQPRNGDPVPVQTGDTRFYRELRRGRLEAITFDVLADGDRVRVEGVWEGDVLMASRVLVKPPAPTDSPAVWNGTISGNPDSEAGTFTLQPRDGDPVGVQAGDSEFYRQLPQGHLESITFDDLADGDPVRVEGAWAGDVFQANRVIVMRAAPRPSNTQ